MIEFIAPKLAEWFKNRKKKRILNLDWNTLSDKQKLSIAQQVIGREFTFHGLCGDIETGIISSVFDFDGKKFSLQVDNSSYGEGATVTYDNDKMFEFIKNGKRYAS